MRTILISLLLVIAVISALSKDNGDKTGITIKTKDATLEQIFNKINTEHKLMVVFSNNAMRDIKKSVSAKNEGVEKFFKEILKDTDYTFKYNKEDGTVVIFKRKDYIKLEFDENERYTLNGFIEDAGSLERLMRATVYNEESEAGSSTNEYGFYSITLPKGKHNLRFGYTGYNDTVIEVDLNRDMEKIIRLKSGIELNEIIVEDKEEEKKKGVNQIGVDQLSTKVMSKLPQFMNEDDIVKTAHYKPGIQSGKEGSANLYVRGGGSGQNLILLDGAPLYNSSHLFGLFSVFNTDAISDVKIYKGAFPARYGGRLSSIVDVRMKEGNMRKFGGDLSIGLMSSKVSFEGPIIKDKTSFILSGRRSYYDLASKLFDSEATSFSFYDLNAKINHKFSNRDRLYFSFYTGKDDITNTEDFKLMVKDALPTINSLQMKWGNITSALRWNHIISSKMFANTALYYSKYDYNITNNSISEVREQPARYITHVPSYLSEFNSGIEDISVRTDIDYIINNNHYFRFGAELTHHIFSPSVNSFDISSAESNIINRGNSDIESQEVHIYAEDEISVNKHINANIGLHFSSFMIDKKKYHSFQPRMSLSLLPSENKEIRLSYSVMSQYLHELSNSRVGLPVNILVPSTKNVKPQESSQIALGYKYKSKWFNVSLEGYYKKMDNLIGYVQNETMLGKGDNWDKYVESGKGNSKGLELMIEKTKGRTTGWISYTLSKSEKKFDNINGGEFYPFEFDRLHDIGVVIMHKLNKKWDFGISWTYGSGYPYSLGVSKYEPVDIGNNANSRLIVDNSKRNNFRLNDYHRLDLNMNYNMNKSWGKSVLSIGLYNVYSQRNVFGYVINPDNGEMSQLTVFSYLFPTISYKISF